MIKSETCKIEGDISLLKDLTLGQKVRTSWHNLDEEPKNNSHILICYSYMGDLEYKSYHIQYEKDITWEDIVKRNNIFNWAYLDDILPEKLKKYDKERI